MKRVLFLDIDGVLNHRANFLPSRHGSPLCPDAIRRLRDVARRTACRVVLSSTWRMVDHFVEQLEAAGGFPGRHDDWRTVQLPVETRNGLIVTPHHRGREIAEWLSRHGEVERYAIVDDDDDMLPEQAPFFVRTSFETGLQDGHVEQLVRILIGARP
jgi:hypothetical protein